MSTAITPTTTSHFGFASFGHYISAGLSKVKTGLQFVESKIIPTAQTVIHEAEVVTGVAAALDVPYASEALLIERAIDSAAGELLAAIHVADGAIGADGTVNLKLSLSSYKLFKQFIDDQKDNLAAAGFKL